MTQVTRRGFLGTLLAAPIAIETFGAPSAAALSVPTPTVAATEFQRWTYECARMLHEALPACTRLDHAGARLGDRGLVGQFNVSMASLEPDHGLSLAEISARYLKPAMWALAHRIKADGYVTFGTLPVPLHVEHGAVINTPRVSVRGIQAYDIYEDALITRFDVLVGRIVLEG